MLWSLLGASTATWLMFTPALWPEAPLRSGLAAAAGLLALGFSVLGVPSRRVRRGMAWLGLLLGLVNFGLAGSLGLVASYAVSAILLVVAGMSPTPEPVAAATVEAARTEVAPEPPVRLAA